MSKNDGGSAFPEVKTIKHYVTDLEVRSVGGMSLRDYFAAKAIQGMFANDSLLKRYAEDGMVNMVSPEVLATTAAYSIADAMLAERAK